MRRGSRRLVIEFPYEDPDVELVEADPDAQPIPVFIPKREDAEVERDDRLANYKSAV